MWLRMQMIRISLLPWSGSCPTVTDSEAQCLIMVILIRHYLCVGVEELSKEAEDTLTWRLRRFVPSSLVAPELVD